MSSVGISEKIVEMSTYQDLGFFGNISASFAKVYAYFGTIFLSIQLFFSRFVSRTTFIVFSLVVALIVSISLGIHYTARDSPETTIVKQKTEFDGIYDSRSIQRKPTSEYFKLKEVVAMNKNNFVLLNLGLLTIKNAGFFGPAVNGSFKPEALQTALQIGARCFIFSIDYYTGEQKPDFAKPGEPCLLYRDSLGAIRSQNSGDIQQMMTILADEGFTQNRNDPLLVILEFKNVPDLLEQKQKHLQFLQSVANKISVLDKNGQVLKKIKDTTFTNQSNPASLFVQKYDDLKNKILIVTNVDTRIFNDQDVVKLNLPRNSNLRMLTHAQIYTASGSSIANDAITQKAPAGTPVSIGKENAPYWLQTPPEAIKDAQTKINATYTYLSDSEFKNESIDTYEQLTSKFGVQLIPFQMYTTPKESEDFFSWWGPYSVKIRSTPLQYIVTYPVEPATISTKLNANGGNPSPPKLNL